MENRPSCADYLLNFILNISGRKGTVVWKLVLFKAVKNEVSTNIWGVMHWPLHMPDDSKYLYWRLLMQSNLMFAFCEAFVETLIWIMTEKNEKSTSSGDYLLNFTLNVLGRKGGVVTYMEISII